MPHNRQMAEKKKSKAGRKKGAVSFCMVPLSELNLKLNENAIVIISRKFASAMGIEGQPIIAAPNMIVPFAQSQVAQSNVQVETFVTKLGRTEMTVKGDLSHLGKTEEELTTPQIEIDEWQNLINKQPMKNNYFPEIIGQNTVKKALGFYIDGYKSTNLIPHMMFTAPRGCGKTTMATAMAKNLTDTEGKIKPLITLNCSTIKNLKQFFNMFVIPYMNDRDATILFDESSELPKDVTMALLTILNPNKENRTSFSYEDYTVDFDFKRLSFLFATTEGQQIFHALMDRMERIDLEEYTYDELGKIVMCGLEGYTVEPKTLLEISSTLRGNARAGQKMAVKLKLLMNAKRKDHFNKEDWELLKDKLGVLPLGLLVTELQILRILAERKEVRLTALAAITGLSKGCIQKDYELYLTKMGLMEINAGGRAPTAKGLKYLKELDGKSVPVKRSKKTKRKAQG